MTVAAIPGMMRAMNSRTSHGGPVSLAAVLPKAASPTLRRRGFAHGAVLANWREIVGPEIAAASCPEKLSFPRAGTDPATLHVRVDGALAVELQHLEPVVVERINGFFGYRAVGRLALVQAPVPRSEPPAKPAVRALTEAETAGIEQAVHAIGDDELRGALRSLGRALAAEV